MILLPRISLRLPLGGKISFYQPSLTPPITFTRFAHLQTCEPIISQL